MTTPILYDSVFGYVEDANIDHFRHSNVDKDAPGVLIEVFQPADDPTFIIDDDDVVEVGGMTYCRANWGEVESSYLLKDALYDCCYVRYILNDEHEYISDGLVYETKEAAELVDTIIENMIDSQYYCMKCRKLFEYRYSDQDSCEQCNAAIDDDNVAEA